MCDGTLNLTGLDSTTNKYHKLTVTGTASLRPKLTFQVETGKEVTTSVHIGPSKCVDDETLQRLIGVSKLKLCYILCFIIAVFLFLWIPLTHHSMHLPMETQTRNSDILLVWPSP